MLQTTTACCADDFDTSGRDRAASNAGEEAREEEDAEKKRDFDRLTEAASELLDLGHEDIYQQSREQLVVSLGR